MAAEEGTPVLGKGIFTVFMNNIVIIDNISSVLNVRSVMKGVPA